eukprot:3957588-Pyramimonas_sp.AAC.1
MPCPAQQLTSSQRPAQEELRSSVSDVYRRLLGFACGRNARLRCVHPSYWSMVLSLIHISEPTRPEPI